MAIALCKATDEYFQYLFGSWDCTHTRFASTGQIRLQHMSATGPKRHYSIYQIVQEYWPEFQAELASHGTKE